MLVARMLHKARRALRSHKGKKGRFRLLVFWFATGRIGNWTVTAAYPQEGLPLLLFATAKQTASVKTPRNAATVTASTRSLLRSQPVAA